jgi:hypothetical protein
MHDVPRRFAIARSVGHRDKPDVELAFDVHGSLSKEHCYVITGDLGALPGGASTADNPTGLRSALCGRTSSATLSFEINPPLRGR